MADSKLLELDVSNLDEIIKILKNNFFTKSNWFRLGIELGLYMPSLETIEDKYKGDTERCLMKCLTLWLQKSDSARLPSWVTLANALRQIDEKAVSEKIIEMNYQLTDPACQILQKYRNKLSQVTLPVQLCQLLLTEKVITKEVLDEIKALGCHFVNGSFRALRYTVRRDHNKLRIFASILLKSEDTVTIANEIFNDYIQTFPMSPLISNLKNATSATSVEVVLEREEFQAEFDRVNSMLGKMIFNVAVLVKAKIPSLEHLSLFITTIRPELQPQLTTAKSFDDVQIIIRNHCSITNIVLLEDVVEQYSVTEAHELISTYKSGIEEFCTKQVPDIVLKKLPFPLLTCETITFIVNWEVTKCTLNNIKDLLQRAFKNSCKNIEVIETKQGNSILITCYAPHYLMDELYIEAQQNIEELKEIGLMKLTISYYVVYDNSKDKEIAAKVEEVKDLEEANYQLTESLSDKEKDIEKINRQLMELLDQKNKREQEGECIHINWEQDLMAIRVRILEAQLRAYQQQIDDLEDEKRAALAERLRYERDYKEERQKLMDYESLTRKLLCTDNSQEVLGHVLKKTREENQDLKAINCELTKRNEQLEKRHQRGSQRNESPILLDRLEQARQQIQELSITKDILEEDNRSYRNDKERAERQVRDLRNEKERTERQLQDLRREKKTMERAYLQQQDQATKDYRQLENAKRRFEHQYEEIKKEKSLVEEELRVQLQYGNVQSDLQRELSHLISRNKFLENEAKRYQSQCNRLVIEIETLKKNIAECNSSHEQEVRYYRQQIAQLESKQMYSVFLQNESHHEELEKLRKEFATLELHKETLEQKKDSLIMKLEGSDKEIKKLTKRVNELEHENKEEKLEYECVEENIALLSEQMKIYKQQLDRANQEAYEYKYRCGQQEKRLQDFESLTKRLQEQINYLQPENNDLQRERNLGLYQQGAIDYNVLQLKEENRALKHEVALNKDQIYDLQLCNEKLGQEKEIAEIQHKQCQTKLYAHVMHNIPVPELPPSHSNQENLQHQLAKERAKRDALEKEYENLLAIKRQRDELQEQLRNKMAELDHLKQSTGQTAYEKEVKLFQNMVKSLEKEVKELEVKNLKLREERDEVAKHLREQKSAKPYKENMPDLFLLWRKHVMKLENERATLVLDKQSIEEELNQLKIKLAPKSEPDLFIGKNSSAASSGIDTQYSVDMLRRLEAKVSTQEVQLNLYKDQSKYFHQTFANIRNAYDELQATMKQCDDTEEIVIQKMTQFELLLDDIYDEYRRLYYTPPPSHGCSSDHTRDDDSFLRNYQYSPFSSSHQSKPKDEYCSKDHQHLSTSVESKRQSSNDDHSRTDFPVSTFSLDDTLEQEKIQTNDNSDITMQLINESVSFAVIYEESSDEPVTLEDSQNSLSNLKSSSVVAEKLVLLSAETNESDTSDDIPENPLLEGIDQDIQYYAEEAREITRPPNDTTEFEVQDSLPYDPNLVCPKCGKRYRIGQIQRFKCHVEERCPNRSSSNIMSPSQNAGECFSTMLEK